MELIYSWLPLAYVDGGSGSMMLQAALASVFAAAYGFRGTINRIVTSIRAKSRKSQNTV